MRLRSEYTPTGRYSAAEAPDGTTAAAATAAVGTAVAGAKRLSGAEYHRFESVLLLRYGLPCWKELLEI